MSHKAADNISLSRTGVRLQSRFMMVFLFFMRAEDREIETKLEIARGEGEFILYLISSVLCNPEALVSTPGTVLVGSPVH